MVPSDSFASVARQRRCARACVRGARQHKGVLVVACAPYVAFACFAWACAGGTRQEDECSACAFMAGSVGTEKMRCVQRLLDEVNSDS